jgi:hypothetical protein
MQPYCWKIQCLEIGRHNKNKIHVDERIIVIVAVLHAVDGIIVLLSLSLSLSLTLSLFQRILYSCCSVAMRQRWFLTRLFNFQFSLTTSCDNIDSTMAGVPKSSVRLVRPSYVRRRATATSTATSSIAKNAWFLILWTMNDDTRRIRRYYQVAILTLNVRRILFTDTSTVLFPGSGWFCEIWLVVCLFVCFVLPLPSFYSFLLPLPLFLLHVVLF